MYIAATNLPQFPAREPVFAQKRLQLRILLGFFGEVERLHAAFVCEETVCVDLDI